MSDGTAHVGLVTPLERRSSALPLETTSGIAIPVVLTGNPSALAIDQFISLGPLVGILVTLSIGIGLFVTARQNV